MTPADLYDGAAVALGLLALLCSALGYGDVRSDDPRHQHAGRCVALLVVACLLGGASVACLGASTPDWTSQ